MSHLLESPPLTEELTVKKVLQAIGTGIFILSNIINSICIAVIFVYLGSTIPVLKPYATYVAGYTFGARIIFLIPLFFIGCYWCCLRLVAPKQAGSSISEWVSKLQAHSEALSLNHGKMSRRWRIFHAIMGVNNIFNGLMYGFRSWKGPDSGYQLPMAVIFLMSGANSIQIAYVGRLSIKKGARDETMTMGNNDGQPESNEVIPACEHKDDDTTVKSLLYGK